MQSTQRDPLRRRVLLFSIDGCRPDALQQAAAPTIHALAASGAVAWNARTVMPSCTLPCHTSMLRGVDTPRHGINSNDFHPLVRPVPSLFEHSKAHGLRTAFFLNWEQLRDLAGPGFVDVGCHLAEAIEPGSDEWIADRAIEQRAFADADFTLGTRMKLGIATAGCHSRTSMPSRVRIAALHVFWMHGKPLAGWRIRRSVLSAITVDTSGRMVPTTMMTS